MLETLVDDTVIWFFKKIRGPRYSVFEESGGRDIGRSSYAEDPLDPKGGATTKKEGQNGVKVGCAGDLLVT